MANFTLLNISSVYFDLWNPQEAVAEDPEIFLQIQEIQGIKVNKSAGHLVVKACTN